MAETKRMTCEQVVGYLLEGEGLDVLRESLISVVAAADGGGGVGAGPALISVLSARARHGVSVASLVVS